MMKSFNKQNIISLVFFLTVSWTSIAHADSLRCESRIVSLGDSKQEVEDICGAPAYVDVTQEEKTIKVYRSKPTRQGTESENHRHRDHEFVNERTIVVNVEEWTYNFGPNRFIQTLKFKNNQLVSIKDDTYGFKKTKDDKIDFSVRKGDSKALIWMKFGEPLDIQKNSTYDINVTHESDGDYFYEERWLIPILDEEWIYDLGPDEYLQKLYFKNNRLVRSQSLKTKGKLKHN
jgi:hypothetical protein